MYIKKEDLNQIHNFANFLATNIITDKEDIESKENIAITEFIHKLYYKNRFFNENHSFFDYVSKLFDNLTIFLTPNESLFRARKIELEDNEKLGIEECFNGFDKKESFVPPVKKMQANRANSDGIPCLYTAKEIKTAIAEVRPFLGKKISIATIKPKANLKLFDLYFNPEQQYEEILKPPHSDLWLNIALKFSIPYENTSKNEYLFTQCISEYLQLSGFDGIQYLSSLCESGKNIAIFNCKHEDDHGNYDICEPICSHIYTVDKIDYDIKSD